MMWIRRNNLAYINSKFIRRIIDLPFITIEKELKKISSSRPGILLNFGSGPSLHYCLPFATETYTLDLLENAQFKTIEDIPKILKFDYILCLEVLEHCQDPEIVLSSFSPILKKDGLIIISTPLNARFHPTPKDYHRFTPDSIKNLASANNFDIQNIIARGSNLTTITNKLIYLCAFFLQKPKTFIFGLILIPFAIFFLLLAHMDLFFFETWGDDPLGYFYLLKCKNNN